MTRRWQYQAKAEPLTVPAPAEVPLDWLVQQPDPVRLRPWLPLETLAYGFADAEITPDYDWYQQHPEQVFRRPHQTGEGYFAYAADIEVLEIDLDWFVQQPEQTWRRPPLVQEGYFVSAPFPIATFSAADWPFLALLDPNDHPAGTSFYLEVVIDTSDANVPAQARLFNITDGAEVAGSTITSPATHLQNTAWVRGSALTLVSGPKEYRVERGAAPGSSVTVHIHQAKINVQLP